jgi:hypothetical protein
VNPYGQFVGAIPLFVSVHAYAWAKNGGVLFEELEAGEASKVACFRTLHRLRRMREVALCLETSTLITRGRCRAAGAFLRSPCQSWVTVDEDVDANDEALSELLRHANQSSLVFAAMRLRGERRYNVELAFGPAPLRKLDDGTTHQCNRAGAALAVFGRAAIQVIAERAPACEEDVPPFGKVQAPVIFFETVEGGRWHSEDVRFCDLARACDVPRYAMFHPGITHAGLSNAELL